MVAGDELDVENTEKHEISVPEYMNSAKIDISVAL